VTQELPSGRYLRVQTSAHGLIGLTDRGQFVAPETLIAPHLPEALTFRSTNMWGNQGVCPLFRDGTFGVSRIGSGSDGTPTATWQAIDGTFARAFCAFEGLSVGIHTDGSLWNPRLETPPGNDWVDLAFSNAIFCALNQRGAVTCVDPESSCSRTPLTGCVGSTLPRFDGSGYRALSATAGAVCAINERSALECQRYDGALMLDDPGPYTSVEGGQSVLCAVRRDGGAARFRHEGETPFPTPKATRFTPIDPPVGGDW